MAVRIVLNGSQTVRSSFWPAPWSDLSTKIQNNFQKRRPTIDLHESHCKFAFGTAYSMSIFIRHPLWIFFNWKLSRISNCAHGSAETLCATKSHAKQSKRMKNDIDSFEWLKTTTTLCSIVVKSKTRNKWSVMKIMRLLFERFAAFVQTFSLFRAVGWICFGLFPLDETHNARAWRWHRRGALERYFKSHFDRIMFYFRGFQWKIGCVSWSESKNSPRGNRHQTVVAIKPSIRSD